MSFKYLEFYPKIDAVFVKELQADVDSWIGLIGSNEESFDIQYFLDVTNRIVLAVSGQKVEGTRLAKLEKALNTVKKLSNFSVSIWESDGKAQTEKQSSLHTLLAKTLVDNFHSVRSECQVYDKKTETCRYGNPLIPGSGDHLFRCDFHMYDSVSIHLVLACLYNTLWAIDNALDDEQIMMGALLGLYHDVAKPLTVETHEFKSQKMPTITGFPGHAELGCMLFQAHWTPEMSCLITEKQFMTVATAILHHMCGYHGDENTSNQYKRDLLLLDQPAVRTLLSLNRVGDHFGKMTNKSDEDETTCHFLKEQRLFETRMLNSEQFDLPAVLRRHKNKCGSINPNKIVLFVIGTSGAGKSFLIEKLQKLFPLDTTVISRDLCIAQVCVNVCQRLVGEDYTTMYKIYEAGKALSALVRKAGTKKHDKRETQEIDQAKQKLIVAQKQWNQYVMNNDRSSLFPEIHVYDPEIDPVPDISSQVQRLFEQQIYGAMDDDKAFLIIDTFMNCFPMAIEANVPKELARYFRVHVHVQCYLERKDSSNVASVTDQLRICGPYGLDNPLHPDGFKNGRSKKSFASLSAEIGTEGPLPRSTFTTRFRPHLVAGVCTRTHSGNNVGYNETFDCLARLAKPLLKVPVDKQFLADPFDESKNRETLNVVEMSHHLQGLNIQRTDIQCTDTQEI